MGSDETSIAPAQPLEPVVAPAVPAPVEHRFEFRGAAAEYFRIWIVNLALSLLTLGVFSAWAKVRRERYFYGNTWVAGAPFEYHAAPLNILKGRAIAVALLVAYVLAGQFSPVVQGVLLSVVGIATPWLLVSGLRFRARYSAWRTVNFRFDGTLAKAVRYYMFFYALLLPTLGLIYPYIRYRQRHFVIEGHRFDRRQLRFAGTASDFFRIYLVAGLLVVVAGGALAGAGALLAWTGILTADGAPSAGSVGILVVGLAYVTLFGGWTYVAARITNVSFNMSWLDGYSFRSTIRVRDLLLIYLTNALAVLASAGMLVPWAQIRLARYRAEHLALIATGDLGAFTAELRPDQGAVGAETAGVFDVDLSL